MKRIAATYQTTQIPKSTLIAIKPKHIDAEKNAIGRYMKELLRHKWRLSGFPLSCDDTLVC